MSDFHDSESLRDRRLIRFFLTGCLLLLLGGVAIVYYAWKAYLREGSPIRTVEKHLESINRGNFLLAYSDFTERFRQETSRSDFQDLIQPYSSALPYRKSEFHQVHISDRQAEIDGMLTGRNWIIFPIHYELEKENGKWKIVQFEWFPPGEQIRI